MKIKAKTKCPCGLELLFKIKKPNWFTPTVQPASCKCGSKFLVISEVDKKAHAKSAPYRRYKTTFDIVDLSEVASKGANNPVSKVFNKVVGAFQKPNEPKF